MLLSNVRRSGLILVLGAACVAALAADGGTTICPDEIQVEQSLTTAADGWESAIAAGPLRLRAIGFYDGHPREHAMLAPDPTEKAPPVDTLSWRFADVPAVWLECSYDQTGVVLRKRLDSRVGNCTVALEPGRVVGGMPMIRSVECH